MEFGIEKCAMLIVKNEKREIREVVELPNQERIRMLGEKENYKNNKSGHHQTSGDKRKNKKKCLWQRKSHQTDKDSDSLLCKMVSNIFKMFKERTMTNGPEDKKVDDDAQDHTSKRCHRQTTCIKNRRRKRTHQD